MATTYKVLGQSNPAATTATTLYTVPAATSAIASTITICNQSTSNDFIESQYDQQVQHWIQNIILHLMVLFHLTIVSV